MRRGDLPGLLARPALLRREGDEQAAVGGHERVAGVEHLDRLDAGVEVAQREVDAGDADALAAALDRRRRSWSSSCRSRGRARACRRSPSRPAACSSRPSSHGLSGRVLERGQVELAVQALGPDREAAVVVAEHAAADVAGVAARTRSARTRPTCRAGRGCATANRLVTATPRARSCVVVGLDGGARSCASACALRASASKRAASRRDQLGHLAVDGVALRGRTRP